MTHCGFLGAENGRGWPAASFFIKFHWVVSLYQGRFFTFRPGGIPTGQRAGSPALCTGLPGWKTAPLLLCCFSGWKGWPGVIPMVSASSPAPMWRFAIITSRLTIIGIFCAPLHGIVQFIFHLNGLGKRIFDDPHDQRHKRRRNANGKDERQPQHSTHRQAERCSPGAAPADAPQGQHVGRGKHLFFFSMRAKNMYRLYSIHRASAALQ